MLNSNLKARLSKGIGDKGLRSSSTFASFLPKQASLSVLLGFLFCFQFFCFVFAGLSLRHLESFKCWAFPLHATFTSVVIHAGIVNGNRLQLTTIRRFSLIENPKIDISHLIRMYELMGRANLCLRIWANPEFSSVCAVNIRNEISAYLVGDSTFVWLPFRIPDLELVKIGLKSPKFPFDWAARHDYATLDGWKNLKESFRHPNGCQN